jgi:hypothetical protein
MEPIIALSIYLTFTALGIGMCYFYEENYSKNVYKNLQ